MYILCVKHDREKVNITTGNNCILLQENDRDKTSIEWNSYVNEGGNPFESATFTSAAEHLVVKNITFKNTYNLEVEGRKVNKAVAASIFGDKSSFYDCGFIGLQDTLADASGRHYFHNCHIEGAMDFIWGNGQSCSWINENVQKLYLPLPFYESLPFCILFQWELDESIRLHVLLLLLYRELLHVLLDYCEITVRTYPRPRYPVTSVTTAQGRESEEQTTGFVFKFGKLNGIGNPTTFLGRAWRTCSTVLFKNMTFSGHGQLVKVLPIGWDHWEKDVRRIVYAEADNTGLASELDDRASWERIGKKIIFVAVAAFACISNNVVNALTAQHVIDSPLLTEKIGTNRTIKVDISGKGDFTSVQAAIDSVPAGNSQWIIIHVRKGLYREKVHIPENKPYIFLRGNGKGRSHIMWNESATDNLESATLRVEANNFIAFGISFKNEAAIGMPFTSTNQSVAALVGADKVAFYHCGFYSAHNTLFDYKGRHYYDNCYIQGTIDFIFGRGQSIFHSCEIFVVGDKRVEIHGSITAQNKQTQEEDSGFVFLKGKVYGIGSSYLGRARGAYSRVVFAKTYLSRAIVPEGWTNWSYVGPTKDLFHAEYDTHGPGAEQEGRAAWSKQLTEKEAAPFMSIDFISGKEWLPVYNED
ncbi:hypothetical protein C5167_030778 [Papaver somniferum]|nr:hypothetical protein C5167_030778 [Papaver somniferum]